MICKGSAGPAAPCRKRFGHGGHTRPMRSCHTCCTAPGSTWCSCSVYKTLNCLFQETQFFFFQRITTKTEDERAGQLLLLIHIIYYVQVLSYIYRMELKRFLWFLRYKLQLPLLMPAAGP
eukprot:c14873_g1_i1 orf=20-379(-)